VRVEQKIGTRGSLMYLQRLLATRPDLLDAGLRAVGALPPESTVDWVSPRADDDWAEYRDGDFLVRIGQRRLRASLSAFWPAGGPQWDALGVAGGVVLLVEAKAHVGEMKSSCAATAARSRETIAAGLDAARRGFGARAAADWMNGCYQLANRLAHLWFLRENGVDARLVLLQFTGHATMPTPSTHDAYHSALSAAFDHLGFGEVTSLPGVVHVYQDVTEIR
jgi:hypothetical protein